MIQNEIDRFGSATFADFAELRFAGMFKQKPGSLLIGFFGKRPLWYDGMGGLLLIAGARGGKLRDVLAYNICAGINACGSMVILDIKGELAAISQDQTPDRKFCIYWNPSKQHGLPSHRINPVDYIRKCSPTLVSDVKVFCENMIPLSGSANAQYFERRGREFLEGIILTLVNLEGVLSLPSLYRVINLIPSGSDAWLDFAFEMSEAGFEVSSRIETEIAEGNKSDGSGYRGILGEIFKAFAPLSDPALMRSISPPYDFSLSDLCKSDQAYQLYLMCPAEFIGPWSPMIKALFVAGMIYKARSPMAPQQTWLLDECAQLGGFPLITKLYSYGAGIGIRPWAVFQSLYQMNAIGPNAENIITASAALRSYFAVRDLETAQSLSRMLGAQTLEYDDGRRQAEASHAKQKMLQSLLNGNGDPLSAGLAYAHLKQEAHRRTKQHRLLRTPDEVLNMPPGKQFIFCDGLAHPIYADRKPYYEQRFMAGRFHPNPYHPPLNAVRVKGWLGHRWRRVITESVPQAFAHYPQYANGTWSRIGD